MKGTIKSAVATGNEYMNKPEYLVIFEDGKEALSFSGKFCQNEGKEVEYTEQTDNGGNLRVYWPKDPNYDNKNSKSTSNGSSVDDRTKDSIERQVALKAAVEFCKDRLELKTDEVTRAADKFINWIQKK